MESVTKIIDKQFRDSMSMFIFLVFCLLAYMVPFIMGLFIEDKESRTNLFLIGFIFQVFFFYLEIIEGSKVGIRDHLYGWNITDAMMPIFYFLHVVLYYWVEEVNGDIPNRINNSVTYDVITIMCLVLSLFKLLQYIRIFTLFSFLVQMIIQSFATLLPFLTLFMMFIAFFSLLFIILGVDVPNDDG